MIEVRNLTKRYRDLVALDDVSFDVAQGEILGFLGRNGLAQALLGDPDVLILDEPTVGLDPIQVREFRDLIRSLAGKHTVVLSTHILSEITATCQKALVIRQGRVVAFDDLEGLARSHQQQDRVISLEEIFVKLYEN